MVRGATNLGVSKETDDAPALRNLSERYGELTAFDGFSPIEDRDTGLLSLFLVAPVSPGGTGLSWWHWSLLVAPVSRASSVLGRLVAWIAVLLAPVAPGGFGLLRGPGHRAGHAVALARVLPDLRRADRNPALSPVRNSLFACGVTVFLRMAAPANRMTCRAGLFRRGLLGVHELPVVFLRGPADGPFGALRRRRGGPVRARRPHLAATAPAGTR